MRPDARELGARLCDWSSMTPRVRCRAGAPSLSSLFLPRTCPRSTVLIAPADRDSAIHAAAPPYSQRTAAERRPAIILLSGVPREQCLCVCKSLAFSSLFLSFGNIITTACVRAPFFYSFARERKRGGGGS